jgi:hypothetical protein
MALSSSQRNQLSNALSNETGSAAERGGYKALASWMIKLDGRRTVREQVQKLTLPWLIINLVWLLFSA